MNYSEAITYLYSSRPPFHLVGKDAYKPGLENTLRLMVHLGNPHEQLRAIYVAGTNGKGSTSHLIAAVLQAQGYKVGLFTSPHLVSLTERIRINGTPIPEDQVADFITRHRAFLDETQPSFFETMTALAFDYFVREQVDFAVVEVGLGGRLDSTNVLTPILSVITNIGLDHTELLGNTLPKIAREKAGIIKPDVPCVRRCRLREAPECDLKGNYQEHNLQTAYVALQVLRRPTPAPFLKGGESFTISRDAIREGFAHVCSLTGLRGRWETLRDKPLIICDTGHNSHGIQYVAKQLRELTNHHVWIVFGMVNDKDTETVMRLLPGGDKFHYIFTTPNTHRARTAEEMLALWGKEGIAINDPKEAIAYALAHASEQDAVFIGGSNYLVGEALQIRNS